MSPDWRANVWKHVFVYFWLSFGLLLALLHPETAVRSVLSVTLVAALGIWYWHWQVTGDGGDAGRSADAGSDGIDAAVAPGTPYRASSKQIYLVGGIALWAALVLLDNTFVVAGVAVLAPYCFGSMRWALLSMVPCVGSWLWQQAVHSGLDWEELVIAIAAVTSGVAVSGYIGSLTRQNTERQQLIDQLQAAQAELAVAERRAGMLAERQRLARDIHDTLTQGFASIVMLLEAAEAALETGGAPTRHVAQALRSARDNLTESRRLVWALRPDALADCQLPDALGDLVDRLQEETGVQAELVVTGTPRGLGRETETSLLRVAQESLANVRKHARAKRATVTVSYMDDVTVLDIQDDGLGFELDATTTSSAGVLGGVGLRAMRERAEELGGHLTVETGPGEGTTVAIEVPSQPAPDPSPAEHPSRPTEPAPVRG